MSKLTEKDEARTDETTRLDERAAETELPATDVGSAVALLQSWNDEDEQEQRETWAFLKAALDEDRLSDRKLFP